MRPGRIFRLLLIGSLAGWAGCTRSTGPAAPPSWLPGPGEISIMSYNLGYYGYLDRDGDGQVNEFKPGAACRALHALIAARQPDILAVQQIGSREDFDRLHQALRDLNLDYSHTNWMEAPQGEFHLGLFSRYPLDGVEHHTPTYRTGGETVPVQRGFQEVLIALPANKVLRVVNVELKSKTFHPAGQNDMRRNESRLLGNRIEAWSANPAGSGLVVAGGINDDPESATVRNLLQPRDATRLIDVNPVDEVGDRWTHVESGLDHYTRRDYLLVSPGLAGQVVEEKTAVVRDERTHVASPHRPLYMVLQLP